MADEEKVMTIPFTISYQSCLKCGTMLISTKNTVKASKHLSEYASQEGRICADCILDYVVLGPGVLNLALLADGITIELKDLTAAAAGLNTEKDGPQL